MKALLINHSGYDDPGHIGTTLASHGISWDLRYREHSTFHRLDEATDYRLLVLLGSLWDPSDLGNPGVRAELDLIQAARDANIPVFGICYGAQLLALAAGARLYDLESPRVGYYRVDFQPGCYRSGPQFFWNHLGFDAPQTSRVLAIGPDSCWAFEDDGILAVQFHPDATAHLLARWTNEGATELAALRISARSIIDRAAEEHSHVEQFCDDALTQLISQPRRLY